MYVYYNHSPIWAHVHRVAVRGLLFFQSSNCRLSTFPSLAASGLLCPLPFSVLPSSCLPLAPARWLV